MVAVIRLVTEGCGYLAQDTAEQNSAKEQRGQEKETLHASFSLSCPLCHLQCEQAIRYRTGMRSLEACFTREHSRATMKMHRKNP